MFTSRNPQDFSERLLGLNDLQSSFEIGCLRVLPPCSSTFLEYESKLEFIAAILSVLKAWKNWNCIVCYTKACIIFNLIGLIKFKIYDWIYFFLEMFPALLNYGSTHGSTCIYITRAHYSIFRKIKLKLVWVLKYVSRFFVSISIFTSKFYLSNNFLSAKYSEMNPLQ
jgi:hypothetical protein